MNNGFYELRRGHQGTDVLRLQLFLVDQGENLEFGADGDFGPDTARGLASYQDRIGVEKTKVLDDATLSAALAEGYENTSFPPGVHPQSSTYPRKPIGLSSPNSESSISMFGKFEFKSAKDPSSPERIKILGDWVGENIVRQPIPHLVDMIDLSGGAPRKMESGTIRCHKLAAPKFVELFEKWGEANLIDRVLYYVGGYNARLKRGRTRFIHSNLSNHSWGSAIDINSRENWLGKVPNLYGARGCIRELVEIANDVGFYWGGHYSSRKDGMHFELAKL